MNTVKSCLTHKSNQIVAVEPSSPVRIALELMRDKKVRSILVIENGALHGIVSQGDCAIKVLLKGLDASKVLAQEIMTKNPITVTLSDSLEQCMGVMVSKHIRHLPVVDGNKVLGVISIGDIVKNIIDQQGVQINYLETYIKGHGAS
ncbi:CBS domain-containing protein [Polynucleobacter antarcticus]|uniref:CBS domain-containing protein n=1 Tax=Polynucleobacter antarcticus TaxID=1743162 RepID=A0A6M9PX91_9BURK|nr:CBS domain-containing protein [Polynucleobacter antarcticus]QKM62456.1 CBS domain-containing protein [Polynucleobacter antarcticus]